MLNNSERKGVAFGRGPILLLSHVCKRMGRVCIFFYLTSFRDDAYVILRVGQTRFLAGVGKNCCDCYFHAASGNTFFSRQNHGGGSGKSNGGDAYSASLEAVIRLGFTRTAVTRGLCRIIFSVVRATTPNMRIVTLANMENVVSIMISWNE